MKSEIYAAYVLFIIAVSTISSISYSYAIQTGEKPTDNTVENYKQIKTGLYGTAVEKVTGTISLALSPLKQMKNGVAIHDIKCKNDLMLVFKSDWAPACIKSTSKQQLTKRGVLSDHNQDHNALEMKNVSKDAGSIPKTPSQKIPKIDKSGFKKAPELQGITEYVNISPDDLKAITKDKVILYDFWTYSCANCKATFPYLKSWHDKYSDKGLVIIGIHYPEFQFEKDINNVRQAVTNNGIKFPVVLDNEGANWDAFGNHYWPRFYLADSEGYIRYDHIGEGSYDETENMIQNLLQEKNTLT
jgi:thiol-disulfide isomerase/thioredoxin